MMRHHTIRGICCIIRFYRILLFIDGFIMLIAIFFLGRMKLDGDRSWRSSSVVRAEES